MENKGIIKVNFSEFNMIINGKEYVEKESLFQLLNDILHDVTFYMMT